jgi:hypothetical protein
MPEDRPHRQPSALERGLVVGILIGEGHFGGDGKYPHITLRMHVRHESLFRWLEALFPRSRLYGPYTHGGRNYYQWMARGAALAEDVLPVIESVLTEELDAYSYERLRAMRTDYADFFRRYGRERGPQAKAGGERRRGPRP